MSEYQRYEFMTSDRPLTRAQQEAVNALSSHIEASSTHALSELQALPGWLMCPGSQDIVHNH